MLFASLLRCNAFINKTGLMYAQSYTLNFRKEGARQVIAKCALTPLFAVYVVNKIFCALWFSGKITLVIERRVDLLE